jgi:hypothetical protein
MRPWYTDFIMQKRSSKPKESRDVNQNAFRIVSEATGDDNTPKPEEGVKNPAAVALGRLGGMKGGKARAEKLTPEQRKEIAKIAASARWKKTDA